jgi:hypothetical protein
MVGIREPRVGTEVPSMSEEFEPHPLVAAQARNINRELAKAPPADDSGLVDEREFRRRAKEEEFVAISGYFGGGVDERFLRLYLDPELRTWALIQRADIVRFERADGPGERDVFWMKADAAVASGRMGEADESLELRAHDVMTVAGWMM